MIKRRLIPLCLISICLTVLAACSSYEQKDSAPARKLDVSNIPDAVPKPERVTIAGNKSPYTVLGKTYRVMESSEGYREKGIGSWYGTKFHGRNTSNGEVYDMYQMTAAHKTLPIPAYVKVTNLNNGRSAIVRVNDRGPFHDGRIIDLSYAAATKLGYADSGTAPVEVEVIRPINYQASSVKQPVLAKRTVGADHKLPFNTFLQAGAFGSRQPADELANRLKGLVSQPVKVKYNQQNSGFHKVLVGPISSSAELARLRQMLAQSVRIDAFVVYH